MGLTNAGRNLLAQMVNGEAVTPYTNANARIAIGDSNAAFVATQTDLQAAVNKIRKAMDATYPQRSVNQITYRVTCDVGEGNFTWNEWGIVNDPAAGTLLNRKVESFGTKANTQIWQFTVTLTFVAA